MRAILIAAALFAAAPAVAQTPASPAVAQTPASPTRLVLADATRASARPAIIDGAVWRCEGAACVASGGANQPAARACRRVVARLGPVTEFAWKGQALSAEQLAVCNA